MKSSETTSRSAPAARARFAADETRSLLPEISPIVGLSCAAAIFMSFHEQCHPVGSRIGGALEPARLGLPCDGVDQRHPSVAVGDPLDRVFPAGESTDEFGNTRLA